MKTRFAAAAALVGASLIAIDLVAQTAPAQPMPSILAGKKFIPPIKGQAEIEYVKTPTRREGSTLVTKIQVKNTSSAPIPRLKVTETWYDKGNNMLPGGEGVINGLLQPGEVQTIEIRTATNAAFQSQMLMFSHAQGTIKPHAVKSLDAPKEPATKTAAAKTAAKKK